MDSDTYDRIRKFWSDRFGFEPSGDREEKIFLELLWVSYQNTRVMREINRYMKENKNAEGPNTSIM